MPSTDTSSNRGAVRRHEASRFQAISLLATDLRMAFILLNQARYRTLERVLGLSREEANIGTLIVALILADAARERALHLRRAFHPPAAGDVALGAAAVRESIYGVAGTSSWEMPLAGTLVTIAVAGGLAAPVVRRAARAIRGSSHALRRALDRQQGRVRRLGSAAEMTTPASRAASI